MYVRNSLHCELLDASLNLESLWIKIKCPNNEVPLLVNVSYNPPNSLNDELVLYLAQSIESYKEQFPRSITFVGGDFNRLDLSDLEIDSGLSILPSPPTRQGATLDVLLTDAPQFVASVSCFSPMIETDHRGVLVRPIKRLPPVRRKRFFRDFSFKRKRIMNVLMESTDFSHVFTIDNIHDAAEWIDQKINDLITEAFPIRQITMSDRDPVWLTPRLKWLLRKKKKANRAKNSEAVDVMNTRLKDSKFHFMKRLGSKTWWRHVDDMTHRQYDTRKIDMDAFDPHELNSDLANRGSLMGKSRYNSPVFVTHDATIPIISLMEVANTLRKCKPTSTGPSLIQSFVFKEYWDILAPIFHYVWSRSLSKAEFPRSYKVANLYPLPKVNNAKDADDIRGISVTSITARLFEKIVHRKWISPGILRVGDPLQFAYKKSLSTVDCLLSMQHHVLSLLDQRAVDGVHAILIDFSKAFDRVVQEKAASTYHKFIESPYIQKWLYDFSLYRSQRLIWKDREMPFLPIDLGCSQGTVGGPNIFSMFTDDLRAKNNTSVIFKYSDDTTSLTPCFQSPVKDQTMNLHNEVCHLKSWSEEKGMKINERKSVHLHFCLNRRPICSCQIHDIGFKTVKETNILGVIFQSDCKFDRHIKRLLSTLKSTLFYLKDARLHGATIDEINLLFQSLIISRIRYGISVYGSDHNALEKVNKFLVRCNEKGYSSKMTSASEILRVEDERLLKNILQNPKHPLHEYIVTRITSSRTRRLIHFSRPKVHTLAFHNSFCNRVLSF